jgi:hypothetical protein
VRAWTRSLYQRMGIHLEQRACGGVLTVDRTLTPEYKCPSAVRAITEGQSFATK